MKSNLLRMICLQFYYNFASSILPGGKAADSRDQHLHVPLLRVLHHLRVVLHAESVHRCHHRQLQRTEEESRWLTGNVHDGGSEEVLQRHEKDGLEEAAESYSTA